MNFKDFWNWFSNRGTREKLTNKIVNWGYFIIVGFIILIVWVVVGNGGEFEDKIEAVKFLFNAIIPLIASWIGAVIAFYFGRSNYEAATRQILALNKDTLDDIMVRNMMIHRKTIVAQKVERGKEKDFDLKERIELYNEIDKDRIPIFSKENKPRFIIHKNILIDYIASKEHNSSVEDTTELTPDTIKLDSFLKETKGFHGFEQPKGFVVVAQNSFLKDAVIKMNDIDNCKDVFVTATGKADEEVIGWLTDSLIKRFLTI